jgi:diguanylate cyclase (GGDEF)-like protein
VIENDTESFLAIREHLARSGFRVQSVANGWEALKHVKDAPVDVVISELTISDMDGCSLREKLLLDPSTRDVPFVFLVPEGQSGKQVGVLRLGVDDCISKPFDPVAVAARVQAVVARRRAYEEMIRVDPLTRLLNRPSVDREIEDELVRAERYERFGSLALLDLDDFARVNAEYGQAMGDLLLTGLGGVVLTDVRRMDIAGRHRGEKFVVYLPETRKQGAATVLRRISDRFALVADTVAGLHATFSVGIVEVPTDGTELPVLLARAEEAVREAKQRGAGQVVLWDDRPDRPVAPAGATE